jgi:hypothetical protein
VKQCSVTKKAESLQAKVRSCQPTASLPFANIVLQTIIFTIFERN